MVGDMLNSLLLHKVDGSTQSQYISHRRCARLETERQLVVGGALKGDILYHLATALIRGQLREQFLTPIHHPHAHRGIHFVSREAVEIAPYLLHIHLHVCHSLSAVDEHGDTVAVGNVDNLLHGIDGTERVGDMCAGHNTGMGREKSAIGIEVQDTFVAEWDDPQRGSRQFAGQLPWNNIGVMFHARHYHLVAGLEESTAKGRRHEIDALRRAAGEDNLVAATGIDESLHLTTHALVPLRSLSRQIVGAAVNVAVKCQVVVGQRFNHCTWFLGGGGIVQINQPMIVYLCIEYRKIHHVIHLLSTYRIET